MQAVCVWAKKTTTVDKTLSGANVVMLIYLPHLAATRINVNQTLSGAHKYLV